MSKLKEVRGVIEKITPPDKFGLNAKAVIKLATPFGRISETVEIPLSSLKHHFYRAGSKPQEGDTTKAFLAYGESVRSAQWFFIPKGGQ